MERGKLCLMHQGSYGPYYNHQTWENGKNVGGTTGGKLHLANRLIWADCGGEHRQSVMRQLSLLWMVLLGLYGLTPRVPADQLGLWTVRSSGVTNALQNIVFGNGRFVAVGYQGTVISSIDGIEWTRRESGTVDSLYTVVFGGGLFVAAGNRGALTVSEDGENWTAINSGTFNPLFGSTYGDGQWVVAGGSNILVSANGFQFFNRPSRFLPRAFLNAIAYGDGRFVGVGAGGYAVWSTNTVDWLPSESPIGNHFTLTHAGGQFVAAGGGLTGFTITATSKDGSLWNGQTLDSFVSIVDITHGNGLYLAVGLFLTFPPPDGPEYVLESRDGKNWLIRDLPVPAAILGLNYVNNQFRGVGNSGLIIESGSFAQASLALRGPPGTNGLELDVRGEIGRQYRLQAAPEPDSTDWQDLLIFTNPTEPDTVLIDPHASRFTRRFYRAVSP